MDTQLRQFHDFHANEEYNIYTHSSRTVCAHAHQLVPESNKQRTEMLYYSTKVPPTYCTHRATTSSNGYFTHYGWLKVILWVQPHIMIGTIHCHLLFAWPSPSSCAGCLPQRSHTALAPPLYGHSEQQAELESRHPEGEKDAKVTQNTVWRYEIMTQT